jgi:hypothetical protein
VDGNVWAVASDDVAANATGAAYHEAGSRRLGSLYRAKNHTDRPRRHLLLFAHRNLVISPPASSGPPMRHDRFTARHKHPVASTDPTETAL